MKKNPFLVVFFMAIIIFTFCYRQKIVDFLQIDWEGWLKPIIIAAIGGSIGGLVTYLYVIYIENKRETRAIQREKKNDEREKKEECTTALLNTQMVLSIQMDELKGLAELCNTFMNYPLENHKTLTLLFTGLNEIHEKVSAIASTVTDNDLQRLKKNEKFIITKQALIHLIVLPFEVFDISNFNIKENTVNHGLLTHYFKELSRCNRKYVKIISIVDHRNVERDIIIQRLVSKRDNTPADFLEFYVMIASKFEMSVKLIEEINKYFILANDLFNKTDDYIRMLDISEPMPAARDEKGNPIFDRLETEAL